MVVIYSTKWWIVVSRCLRNDFQSCKTGEKRHCCRQLSGRLHCRYCYYTYLCFWLCSSDITRCGEQFPERRHRLQSCGGTGVQVLILAVISVKSFTTSGCLVGTHVEKQSRTGVMPNMSHCQITRSTRFVRHVEIIKAYPVKVYNLSTSGNHHFCDFIPHFTNRHMGILFIAVGQDTLDVCSLYL